jgi:hypothetical protein
MVLAGQLQAKKLPASSVDGAVAHEGSTASWARNTPVELHALLPGALYQSHRGSGLELHTKLLTYYCLGVILAPLSLRALP